jgi:transcriptional regulator with XRE-family HTH domain
MPGLIQHKYGYSFLKSSKIAMVKKNQVTVKQPELGQKILELRKAKGFTQEELVDRCKINVRTIQRIEAGEVMPRMFTIKTILEALGYDLNEIQFREAEEEAAGPSVNKNAPLLKTAFFLGIAYFFTGFVESFIDMAVWGMFPVPSFQATVPFFGYLSLKLAIFLTFAGFMLGFYRMTSWYPNSLVKIAAIVLAGLTLVSCAVDSYSFYVGRAHLFFLLVESIGFGIAYTVFSIGMMRYRKVFGDLAFFGGILGVVTGLCFMTVFLAIPALVLLTLFEILLLILLYRAYEHTARKYQAANVPPAIE